MPSPKIIFDHDLGANPDDFFALLLVASVAPEQLMLAISGNCHPVARASAMKHLLRLIGLSHVPSVAGAAEGCTDIMDLELGQDTPTPDALGVEEIVAKEVQRGSSITWLAIQGLANLQSFHARFPEECAEIEIIHMGLSTAGYEVGFINGGTNCLAAPSATKAIYSAGLRLRAVGLQTTLKDELRVVPGSPLYERLAASKTAIGQLLFLHMKRFYQRRGLWPAMHDPLTASIGLGLCFVKFDTTHVDFNEHSEYRRGTRTSVVVSQAECDTRGFMQFLAERISKYF